MIRRTRHAVRATGDAALGRPLLGGASTPPRRDPARAVVAGVAGGPDAAAPARAATGTPHG